MNPFLYRLAKKVRALYYRPNLYRGEMLRSACMSTNLTLRFGIFEILGLNAAERAALAWRPGELQLMEEISLAFDCIEEHRMRGVVIDPSDHERLIHVLAQYFVYLKQPRTKAALRELVDAYLAANSVPDPDQCIEEVTVDHPLLERLCEINEEIANESSDRFGTDSLGHVGLYVDRQLDGARYSHCTPRNVRTFASTGGGGTHFSFLVQDSMITEASPVVMTAPDHFAQSVIVGEDLFDFLCLGCRVGFAGLEYLADFDSVEHVLRACTAAEAEAVPDGESTADAEFRAFHRHLLDYLMENLDLRPWTSPERFYELQEAYAPLLKLPPGVVRQKRL